MNVKRVAEGQVPSLRVFVAVSVHGKTLTLDIKGAYTF